MMNANQARELNIDKIVNNTQDNYFFEIPPYQRLYEWEEKQIETLLEDVKKAQKDQKEKKYFIGNIVVSKEKGRYVLIDGQQRLTTLFLIGIYLAWSEKNDSKKWGNFIRQNKTLRITMPLREEEERTLSGLIDAIVSGEKKFQDALDPLPPIHTKKGLKTIRAWFKRNYEEEQGKDVSGSGAQGEKTALSDFSDFLYSNVCFAFVELAKGTDLNRFFVRMNNRGKQLEKHEILKARLLGVIRGSDEKDDWKKYAKIWDLCSDMDKYILQSAGDRGIFNPNSTDQGGDERTLSDILSSEEVQSNVLCLSSDDSQEKVKSIIDFPTFLLHIAKLRNVNISIDKNKLLDLIVIDKEGTKELKIDDAQANDTFVQNAKSFILTMLRYRILFDYFVIKQITDEKSNKNGEYAIKRLRKYTQRGRKQAQYSISESDQMTNLAMLQNYLRVARAGENQNYHHWLTAFLKKVGEEETNCKHIEIIDQAELFLNPDDLLIPQKDDIIEKEQTCIAFLEGLDTALALEQMQENGGDLLKVANQWLEKKDDVSVGSQSKAENFNSWASEHLNQGTATPHYWFYRLEYYLWKNGRNHLTDKDPEIGGKTFSKIRENYRFRALNSVEHIHPQSEKGQWEEEKKQGQDTYGIDDFGNLALISRNFNSSLGNQNIQKKFVDVQEGVKDNRVESLKMCLAYVTRKDEQWTPETAKIHQEEMLDILRKSFFEIL